MVPRAMTGERVGVIHVHSNYSHDGRDSLEALKAFALARGLCFVGLTDHAEDFDAGRFVEFLERCRALSDSQVALLPGLEFRFVGHAGLHLLALGLDRWIEPETPDAFIALTRGAARFTMAAHPTLFDYRLPEAVAAGIDGIEVWNAAYNTRFLPDPAAIRLLGRVQARRPEVVGTAGLDQHDSRNDRETRIVLVDPAATDPLGELKAGRFRNRGRTMEFASRQPFGPIGLGALTAVRAGLDLVNLVHERASLALRRVA